ncbi:unnamed protein product, partial [marine sediment metagenome]
IYFPPIHFNVPTIPPKPTPTGVKCIECAGGVAEPYRPSEERNLSLMTSYQIGSFINPQRLGEMGLKTSYSFFIIVAPEETNLQLKTEVYSIVVTELFGMKHDGYTKADKLGMVGYKGIAGYSKSTIAA